MTEDSSTEMEVEETGEETVPEPARPSPRRQGSGVWLVLTVILLAGCAALAWLYTEQLGEVDALQAEADAASTELLTLRRDNIRMRGEIREVVESLREVLEAVDKLKEAEVVPSEGAPPTEAEEPGAEPPQAEEAPAAEAPTEPEPEAVRQRRPAMPPGPPGAQ